MNLNHIKRTTVAIMLGAVLSGCSTIAALDEVVEDNTKKYQRAETMPPLAIPADLSGARINDDITGQQNSEIYSEYEDSSVSPLAEKYDVEPETKPILIGEGLDRHLVVTGDSDEIWQQLLNFWQQQGIEVRRKDARIGLMDTEADADDGYAYRARMERSTDSGKVEIYITSAAFNNNDVRNEATMRQLAEYLGELHLEKTSKPQVKQQRSTPVVKAQPQVRRQAPVQPQQQTVVTQGVPRIKTVLIDEARDHYALMVEQTFAEAWRSVGYVLESEEFRIEDRERSNGIYYILFIDPFYGAERNEGFMSKMAFWGDDDKAAPEYFYLKLIEVEDETKVIVLDDDQVRSPTETARRLLSAVQKHLAR